MKNPQQNTKSPKKSTHEWIVLHLISRDKSFLISFVVVANRLIDWPNNPFFSSFFLFFIHTRRITLTNTHLILDSMCSLQHQLTCSKLFGLLFSIPWIVQWQFICFDAGDSEIFANKIIQYNNVLISQRPKKW